ncbi:phytanoyl- dioxygenase family protein [Penicillium lagena]|uniref:phytanoyl- dioxygenase family protein n=1 Tax=Penicillium lagena TaxID=94218 RepID=UPI0025423A90|nr:phytanoyl- dioxygenase family protein [Penicillium lagena]KAJ5610785.1 phytanoyl- dioxygenase family protein [Penicillium lagena]
MPSLSEFPVSIRVSDEERDSGVLSDHHLYDVVEAFFNDGFVVLENAGRNDMIDNLNERNAPGYGEAHGGPLNNKVAKKGAKAGGNLSQVPPLEKGGSITSFTAARIVYLFMDNPKPGAEWLRPEIFANKHAAQLIYCILGPKPEIHFLCSNTLLNNNDRQRVHSDMRFEHPTHPLPLPSPPPRGLGKDCTCQDRQRVLGQSMEKMKATK